MDYNNSPCFRLLSLASQGYGRAGDGHWAFVEEAAGMEEDGREKVQRWWKAALKEMLVSEVPGLSREKRRSLVVVDSKVSKSGMIT